MENGERSMPSVSLPGDLHCNLITLCHQAVIHLALAYLAFWELLSWNYCAALPLTSMESHFKDLLKFIIALASENIALHSTWCPINKVSLEMIFPGKAYACAKELVSFILSNTRNSVIACFTIFSKKAQNQIST